MGQIDMFDNCDWHFDGPDYVPEYDRERLKGHLLCTYDIMRDGQWRTLEEIEYLLDSRFNEKAMQTSISALLRDFRKVRYGSHFVPKRRRGDFKKGLWEYQLITKDKEAEYLKTEDGKKALRSKKTSKGSPLSASEEAGA